MRDSVDAALVDHFNLVARRNCVSAQEMDGRPREVRRRCPNICCPCTSGGCLSALSLDPGAQAVVPAACRAALVATPGYFGNGRLPARNFAHVAVSRSGKDAFASSKSRSLARRAALRSRFPLRIRSLASFGSALPSGYGVLCLPQGRVFEGKGIAACHVVTAEAALPFVYLLSYCLCCC